jgi:hypothetical protein
MHSQKLVLPFSEVSQSLGFPTSAAGYVARQRGIFPVRVRQIGGKLVCFKADIDRYLEDGISQSHLSIPPVKSKPTARVGRPRKTESLEAARRGLSVSEMRAQSTDDRVPAPPLKKRGRPSTVEKEKSRVAQQRDARTSDMFSVPEVSHV